MDILWEAAGICAIVFFLFFALAQHWQKILGQQSSIIRRLNDRLRDLQEMVDPEFRRRITEFAPMPLDQVFHFTFRFDDHFWRDRLQISAGNWDFIRAYGTFVGSVKLELWRSHTEAAIIEVLPEGSAARWQTRTVDFYPDAAKLHDGVTLWELRLAPANGTAERVPSLELILRAYCLELWGQGLPLHEGATDVSRNALAPKHERGELLFRVPLDREQLAEFRSHDPADSTNGDSEDYREGTSRFDGSSWKAFYSHRDDNLGVEWQLRLRDLSKKAQWERWKILESPPIHYSAGQK